ILAEIDSGKVPNAKNLEDFAKDDKNIGVVWGISALGFAYDKKQIKYKDLEPPQSWKDLAKPEYKNEIVLPDIKLTYAHAALVMWARANGGSAKQIDPGFAEAKKVKANTSAISPKPDISQYFEQGEASIGIWIDSEAYDFKDSYDYPLQFVYPDDGAPI